MASIEASAATRKRSFFRFYLPCSIVVLTFLALTVLWVWPAPEWERVNRVVGTMLVAQLALLLLALWFLLFSGLRLAVRLATLAALALMVWASVRQVHFTGDLVPIVHFRWSPSQDEILEAHRQHQAPLANVEAAQRAAAQPADLPSYRGPRRDGLVNGPPLARDWKANPPRLLWRQPVGGGYSSITVVGNAAVTLEQRRDEEAVVCYDSATGQERWVHSYPAHFKESLGGDGPRATPTIDDGDVFSLGATGQLVCLELATGKLKWSVNILQDNDNITWGMSGSPLVYDDVVVVNPGAQRESAAHHALMALSRTTGKPVWSSGSTRAGYSSPMLATIAGHQQILLFDGEGLGGYDPASGEELWRYPWEVQQGINVAQPIVLDGERIFISSSYGVGCAMLQLAEMDGKWSIEQLWRNMNLRSRFSNPVARNGFLYGLDEGILVCLDPITGERKWKGGRYGHGQLLVTEDLLLILSETGQLVLVEASPEAHRELATFQAIEGKTWNYPALANGRAFIRNHLEMACYDLRAGKGKEGSDANVERNPR